MVVSYLGTNYHGSAYNKDPEIPTISGTVFKAIADSGAITESNSTDPRKCSFSTSSRTDKGVHAAATLISLKMCNLFSNQTNEEIMRTQIQERMKKKKKRVRNKSNDDLPSKQKNNEIEIEHKCNKEDKSPSISHKSSTNAAKQENEIMSDVKLQSIAKQIEIRREICEWQQMTDLLNKHLPNDIRIQGIHRTIKNFDPRFRASSRIYHYICPAYVFDKDIKPQMIPNFIQKLYDSIVQKLKNRKKKIIKEMIANENENGNEITINLSTDSINMIMDNTITEMKENANDPRIGYRLNDNLLSKLESLLKMFDGTSNYHNFSRMIHANEARAKRHLYYVRIENSSLIFNDIQFIQFSIHGMSFLYHQIRKMIGFIIVLMREMPFEYKENVEILESKDSNPNRFQSRTVSESVHDQQDIIKYAFSVDHKMGIPLAPSAGLYLYKVMYDSYNKHCNRLNLEWNQIKFDLYDDGIQTFIMEQILPLIVQSEICLDGNGNQFAFWIYSTEEKYNFEILHVTDELLKDMKERGMKFIVAGTSDERNTHEFLKKLAFMISAKE